MKASAMVLTLLLVLAIALGTVGCVGEKITLSPAPTPTSGSTTILTPVTTPTPMYVPATTPVPTPTLGSAEAIERPTQSTELITRQYKWSYGGYEWTWSLNVPEVLYDFYKEKPRPDFNYSIYVTHPEDDSYLDMLVQKIEEAAVEKGFSEWETINLAVSFVQSLPYTTDSVTTSYDEYPRYPIETLVDNGGDCEDTSILMAALLDAMGYGVVLFALPSPDPEHVAVGLLGGEGIYGTYWEHNGGKYFYLETTGEGYEIGVLPSEYEGKSAYIYDIVPVPILTHSWEATSEGYYYYKLVVTVANSGTATAQDVYVYAGFDAGSDMFWNSQQSTRFNLLPEQSISVTLVLLIPSGKYTRIVVQTVDDGYAVDQSYSEWFNTR